jgi:flagellar biosynthesis anti-sigma factor FlgM
MKVDGTNTAIQIDAYMRQNRQQEGARVQENSGQPGTKVDKVEISQAAIETQKAAQMLKGAPEVREDKVHQVKLDIQNGRYAVPAEKVATNMLNEGFENDLILKKIDTQA